MKKVRFRPIADVRTPTHTSGVIKDILYALLTLWLIASTCFWLIGFAIFGGFWLPRLDSPARPLLAAYRLVIFYLPWIILAVVAVVKWRSVAFEGDKKPKV